MTAPTVTDLKVQTYPIIPPTWVRAYDRVIYPKRVLPFAMSPRGSRMHRVRWATVHPPMIVDGQEVMPTRMPVNTWCGQVLHHAALQDDPGEWEICGTCEGRAIGAGQIPTPSGYDTDLIFSPRPHVGWCGWKIRGYCRGYDYSPDRICKVRGRAVATLNGEKVIVCTKHARIATGKGWTLEPAQ